MSSFIHQAATRRKYILELRKYQTLLTSVKVEQVH